MIDQVIAWSVQNRVAVVCAALVLAAWGGYSVWVAPVDAIPDLSENQVIVHAEWPGHGPSEVEDQVTATLGMELNGVRGVKTVRSSSDFGTSTLWVIFDDAVDVPTARRRLSDRLTDSDARTRLPPGVIPRLAPEGPATGQIFWYTVEGPGFDLGRLRMVQDWYIKPQLATVAGVAEVASVGGMAPELQVEADPIRLRANKVALSDVITAVSNANGSSGGGVLHKGNAEFVVRAVNWIGDQSGTFDPETALADLRRVVVPSLDGRTVLIDDLATVGFGPQPRRGALEKDGVEVAGGVVLMAYGENPLELTNRLKSKIRELVPGLPKGMRIVPMYDRTPLIRGAVDTVSGTILEAMISASICVLLILNHMRAALVIVLTLPLSALASFGVLEILRRFGIADIQVNAMSLAGLAISIGVLVDSAIVMTENVLHTLHVRFGDEPAQGDVSQLVIQACRQVGRPILFSILIMLLSFLPVFALSGIEGKMFRPLAATKTMALAASGLMAITLVPALSSLMIRGRSRREADNRIVRSVTEVYRPVLNSLLDNPSPLLWLLGLTFVIATAAIGLQWLFLSSLAASLLAVGLTARPWRNRAIGMGLLVVIAVWANGSIKPLGREFLTPLDEGMVMDMPISIPRVSITQGIDDMKARDMILCRFPEVAMVVGKLGRAETPTDPAPLDMIETMVEFHPREFWPARTLTHADAVRQAESVVAAMVGHDLIDAVNPSVVDEIVKSAEPLFDIQLREYAYHRNRELFRSPEFEESAWRLRGLSNEAKWRWREHARSVDAELLVRAAELFTRIVIEETLAKATHRKPGLRPYLTEVLRLRSDLSTTQHHPSIASSDGMSRTAAMPVGLTPQPELDAVQDELSKSFMRRLVLWRKRRDDLIGFGGELDKALPMPGWTNVWTMPIQNRVDMLSTGVNTAVGIRVMGRNLDDVVAVSGQIAAIVKTIPGAADVVADPVRGKGVIEVRADRDRAARLGVTIGEINMIVESALGGSVASTVINGRERTPIRVRYARSSRIDEESVRNLLIRSLAPGTTGPVNLIRLDDVASVRVLDGPATIKGENGLPRNYVRLNVRGRGVSDFVDKAREIVHQRVTLPEGCYYEWTGQFEHEQHAWRTLSFVLPAVLALIFGILYLTYRDLADACLMMLAVPGAIAGGVICQWLMGARFSVTIWVGYIACFGMATSTGVIMLVYLRDALKQAGGIEGVDAQRLRKAILDGAAHRLRPKLLTEATIILGLAPMLWAGGIGGEIIRPMAAPVLGGILVADEVIDLFLPILFYHVRRRRLERHIQSQQIKIM